MAMGRNQENLEEALGQSGTRIDQQNNFGTTLNLAFGQPGTYNLTLNSCEGRRPRDEILVSQGFIGRDGENNGPKNSIGMSGPRMIPGGNNAPGVNKSPSLIQVPTSASQQGNFNFGPAHAGNPSSPFSTGMNNNGQTHLHPIAILLPSNNGIRPVSDIFK